MTHNQLDVTFEGQNQGCSKYALFNTFNQKNVGMVTECHIGLDLIKNLGFGY